MKLDLKRIMDFLFVGPIVIYCISAALDFSRRDYDYAILSTFLMLLSVYFWEYRRVYLS